jgi:diaminopimelate epimerase
MNLHFYKYQGAGNDFVLVDNRQNVLIQQSTPTETIELLCHRRFGVGADGLMLLQNHPNYDFEMVYYNSDGKTSSMCGNGGRCIVAFAHKLGIIEDKTTFLAVDGEHDAFVFEDGNRIKLKMNDVKDIEQADGFYYLNTGSPHYVEFVPELENFDVFGKGREIRYNDRFRSVGTNVNFVEYNDLSTNQIRLRTYERGVEDETLACGTGTVASAISAAIRSGYKYNEFAAQVQGGDLKVYFELTPEKYFQNVWLEGPATFVFEGDMDIKL